MMAMISSAALPKVAFSSPPTPSPIRSASSSVACPITPASGTIPRHEITKTARASECSTNSITNATGTNTRSSFMRLPRLSLFSTPAIVACRLGGGRDAGRPGRRADYRRARAGATPRALARRRRAAGAPPAPRGASPAARFLHLERRFPTRDLSPPQTGFMSATTILIVEDNADNRDIYTTMLRHHGYQVAEAENGEEGIRLARELLPGVVLMDVSMPGIDGLEATRRLKADPRTAAIPVIAVTAQDRKSTR